jgi:hypothetical protein
MIDPRRQHRRPLDVSTLGAEALGLELDEYLEEFEFNDPPPNLQDAKGTE